MAEETRVSIDSPAVADQLEEFCSDLALDQLAEQLELGGVISRHEFDSVVEELESSGKSSDTMAVADALVRTERVSLYQIWVAAAGDCDRLTLGEYTVVEPLGAGGMGEVLLAVHRRMKRKVAIKFLPAHFADDEDMVKRFQREVEVAAKLSHPNIVTAHDAGQAGTMHYLVMEYVDGCDLGGLIRTNGPIPVEDAIKCVLQAGRGIAHAHAKEVIHRDIKPANLLVDRDGNVKVLDMGLARWSNAAANASASDLSITGAVMGTVDFMSPEQAVSAKSADHRADVYSLGCTLYTLVHGQPIYEGDTVIEKVMAHQGSDIPDLVAGDNEHAQQLNDVFRRMLAKSPAERYATIEDACQALADCRQESSPDLLVHLPIPDRQPVGSYSLQDTKDRRPEASFLSTVARTDEKDLSPTVAAPPAKGRGRGIGFVAVVALLLAGGGFFGVPIILKLVTPDGTLVVKCHVPGAIVEVDGERMIEVTDPNSQDTYRFDLPQGEYKVRAILPDGTELQSDVLAISSKKEKLFEVELERGLSDVESDLANADSAIDDPDVLTVARDGSAEYNTISAAVTNVQSGQTIRIIDDGIYEESLDLTLPERLADITIEATGNSRWLSTPGYPRILVIRGVQGIKLRELTFAIRPGAGANGVVFNDSCEGAKIENCTFTTSDKRAGLANSLLSLEGLTHEPGEQPVVVTDCRFESATQGIQVMGMIMASHQPMATGGILIRDCSFNECGYGIGCLGEVHDTWIVHNSFAGCPGAGVQFQHLLGESTNIVVANNSMFDAPSSIRIWEDGVKQAGVNVYANVTLSAAGDEWMTWDSGGNDQQAKGPGDGAGFAESWNFANNFREGKRPPDDWVLFSGWIPPAETSSLLEEIKVLSRDPAADDFLRPDSDSPLATGGLGGDFAAYAGAVPPEGAEPFDWATAFERSIVLSRVPDDVITVAKDQIAHFDTIGEALEGIRPGMTIRVIDDEEYEESLYLDDDEKYLGITIEATNNAALVATEGAQRLVAIQRVPGITIRGFVLDMRRAGRVGGTAARQASPTAVGLYDSCPGTSMESLRVLGPANNPSCNGVQMEFLNDSLGPEPVVIRDCVFSDCMFGFRISGIYNDYESTQICRGFAIIDNRFERNGLGIVMLGDIQDVVVAGNVMDRCEIVGIQLEQLAESAKNIVLTNNTVHRCRFGIRVWSEKFHGTKVQALNNATFQSDMDWGYLDNGGDPFTPKGPGNISQLQKDWRIAGNFRGDDPPSQFAEAWIPASPEDAQSRDPQFESRNSGDDGYLRPASDSRLAKDGVGAEFPEYIGALPPEDVEPFDWSPLISEVMANGGEDSESPEAEKPTQDEASEQ